VPTQIFAPTNDSFVSYSSSSFLAKEIPGAELVSCFQNGHMVMLEDPQFVSQELFSFLTRNKPIY
jgi:pimeloyl-ACP methyl ester carboxylesterase